MVGAYLIPGFLQKGLLDMPGIFMFVISLSLVKEFSVLPLPGLWPL